MLSDDLIKNRLLNGYRTYSGLSKKRVVQHQPMWDQLLGLRLMLLRRVETDLERRSGARRMRHISDILTPNKTPFTTELAKSEDVLRPFILSLETKNPKLTPIAVGCLQRLISHHAVPEVNSTSPPTRSLPLITFGCLLPPSTIKQKDIYTPCTEVA